MKYRIFFFLALFITGCNTSEPDVGYTFYNDCMLRIVFVDEDGNNLIESGAFNADKFRIYDWYNGRYIMATDGESNFGYSIWLQREDTEAEEFPLLGAHVITTAFVFSHSFSPSRNDSLMTNERIFCYNYDDEARSDTVRSVALRTSPAPTAWYTLLQELYRNGKLVWERSKDEGTPVIFHVTMPSLRP